MLKHKWTEQEIDILQRLWPHYGTCGIEDILNLKRSVIKAKVNKLKLTLLPKNKRICPKCQEGYQFKRNLKCRDCHLKDRKINRQKGMSLEYWMKSATNTVKYRNKLGSNLTFEYMLELWKLQDGKCYYSGLELKQPQYGIRRCLYSASIDRVDTTQGYIKGNVVWCCWGCNAGKADGSIEDYITICKAVAKKQSS